MTQFQASLAVIAILGACVTPAKATLIPAVIYEETFDSALPLSGSTFNNFGGNATASVVSGQLRVVNGGNQMTYLSDESFTQDSFTVRGQMGRVSGGVGSSAMGIVIGNRSFIFFPGHDQGNDGPSGNGDGAFRIYGLVSSATTLPTGIITSNQDMGFVPGANTSPTPLHSFEIDVDAINEVFSISITGPPIGGGPNVTFNYNFDDTTFAAGGSFIPGPVGFTTIFGGATTAVFDNLQVETLVEVPEPSSFLLLSLGTLGLVRHARQRRRRA